MLIWVLLQTFVGGIWMTGAAVLALWMQLGLPVGALLMSLATILTAVFVAREAPAAQKVVTGFVAGSSALFFMVVMGVGLIGLMRF